MPADVVTGAGSHYVTFLLVIAQIRHELSIFCVSFTHGIQIIWFLLEGYQVPEGGYWNYT